MSHMMRIRVLRGMCNVTPEHIGRSYGSLGEVCRAWGIKVPHHLRRHDKDNRLNRRDSELIVGVVGTLLVCW